MLVNIRNTYERDMGRTHRRSGGTRRIGRGPVLPSIIGGVAQSYEPRRLVAVSQKVSSHYELIK